MNTFRCFTVFGFASAIALAQYVAIDLTPTSSGVAGANGAAASMQVGSNADHAAMWSGSAGSAADLHPTGWYRSVAQGAGLNQQVGFGAPVASSDASGGYHALLWFGANTGFVDLQPKSGYSASLAFCTTGSQQAGYAFVKTSGKGGTPPPTHAALWSGTSSSFIDLNPAGQYQSRAFGCAAGQQVGETMATSTAYEHAALWLGAAASATDLNPSGWDSSVAFATSGSQQAGTGLIGGARHALLWSGSAASAVDLHPGGYIMSVAYATNGAQQAGTAKDTALPPKNHAIVWSGTAASAVDLNQFLPAGFTEATALGIDEAGNVVGTMTSTSPTGVVTQHAVLWARAQ